MCACTHAYICIIGAYACKSVDMNSFILSHVFILMDTAYYFAIGIYYFLFFGKLYVNYA